MGQLLDYWLYEIPKGDLRIMSMFGIAVHWWILQYTIGLPLFAVIFEILGRKKQDEFFLNMSRTFSKIAAMIFAVGAVTGTLSEFGLVLFWPNLTLLVGMYFFFPMYLEVFAFIAEAIFIYMYYYTWDKTKPVFHIFVGALAAVGTVISALMIVSVNTLMNIPPGLVPGYDPMTGAWNEPMFRLVLPDGSIVTLPSSQVREVMFSDPEMFHAILFETVKSVGVFGIVFSVRGVLPSFLHAVLSAFLTTGFTIIGVYSWRYLTARNDTEKNYYLTGMKILSILMLIFIVLQGGVGDALGRIVARFNPEKFAAMEGTSSDIISITKLLGIEWLIARLSYGSPRAHLPNYDLIPAEWRPPLLLHYVYYSKIGLAILLGIDALILVTSWYILKHDVPKIIIKLNVAAPVIVQLVSTFGWMVREIGRKPWTVYGLLKVGEAATINEVSLIFIAGITLYIFSLGVGLLATVYYVFKRRGA